MILTALLYHKKDWVLTSL